MEDDIKLVQWFEKVDWIQAGARVTVILVITFVLVFIARRLIGGLEKFTALHAHDIEAKRRAATVSNVLSKLATTIIAALATLAILNALGISIMPFLATAGVAGIAIAFGAQSLVKDFFRGFFLLAGNQIRQGDVVEIAGKSGLVEDVTLRYVQLRDYSGNVHFVPNGDISVVTSSSRTFAYAVIDVVIALDQPVDPVIDVMHQVAAQLRAHAEFGPKILEDLDIAGIESWTSGGITLRARMKAQALEQSNVKREFLLRLKKAFDDHRIQQPRNTVMMLDKVPETRSAAPEGPPS
ncbi:MAG TPA: mechanosensitive ion channel domain-containing protein [Vicinamibacterales bacterium]